MSYAHPKYIIFNLGSAVDNLRELYPGLTDRDIGSITEQVIYSFLEQSSLTRTGARPHLEIERLPDSYGIIRCLTECDTLQEAFRRYHETIRSILLSFGMEAGYLNEDRGYIYDRFLGHYNKLVLRGL